MKLRSLAPLAAFCIGALTGARGQVPPEKFDVLTQHNDKYRSGVYPSETVLTPASVSNQRFGKIFARRVLGQIWGQPLYVRGVPIEGKLHNVVYVATSENWVYGFDADDRTPGEFTAPLVYQFLGVPVSIDKDVSFLTIFPSNGISSTPVIDLGVPANPATGLLYVVARLSLANKFHIFALDLATLAIRTDVIVRGIAPGQDNSTISFDSDKDHLNRPSLLISGNHLVVAFGSGPNNDWDFSGYHGWVMSYALPGLLQTGVFVTTPSTNTGMGAVWQSGNGPAADDQGNVYIMSGNGPFQSDKPLPDLTNSFIKLASSNGSLQLVDWYSPSSRDVLAHCDLDLGSSGPAVIQDGGKVLGVGKSGILYVLNKEHMGKTQPALPNPQQWRGDADCTPGECFRVAENQYQPPGATKLACTADFPDGSDNWQAAVDSYPHVHGAPVVWKMGSNSFNLYVWPEQDYLKGYHFDGQQFSTNPATSSIAAAMMSMPGGVLSLSWNGADPGSGVIWTARPNPMPGGTAVGTPFVSAFNDQQHFVFRNRDGTIWDSYYIRGAGWHMQPINTAGPPAAGDMFVSVFTAADQQHFVYQDRLHNIWDSLYVRSQDAWRFNVIDTQNHVPAGAAVVSAFYDQQHFVWPDAAGRIWITTSLSMTINGTFRRSPPTATPPLETYSSRFSPPPTSSILSTPTPLETSGIPITSEAIPGITSRSMLRGMCRWAVCSSPLSSINSISPGETRLEEYGITTSLSMTISGISSRINTSGHPAAGNLFVSVFDSAAQQHFVYTDAQKNIWDFFYIRSQDTWGYQQIETSGHAPVSGISVSAFFDQQHFVWIDSTGSVWDRFYSQEGDHWQTHTVSSCTIPNTDLTPNDGPCNGINKIVRGYIQAFAATPRNGQLIELWNSEQNQNDSVQWFAKQSPPTIADGKVFAVEFPPRVPGKSPRDWSANTAFGRLIVYSLR